MDSLYSLVKNAHQTARDQANGQAVTEVRFNKEPLDFPDATLDMRMEARFHWSSQQLRELKVTVRDVAPATPFTKMELESIMSHTQDPRFILITGGSTPYLDNEPEIKAGILNVSRWSFGHMYDSSSDQERALELASSDEGYKPLDMDELAAILRFKPGENKRHRMLHYGITGYERVADAMEWMIGHGLDAQAYLTRSGARSVSITAGIRQHGDSAENYFSLRESRNMGREGTRGLREGDVDRIEDVATSYRNVSFEGSTFAIGSYDVLDEEGEGSPGGKVDDKRAGFYQNIGIWVPPSKSFLGHIPISYTGKG